MAALFPMPKRITGVPIIDQIMAQQAVQPQDLPETSDPYRSPDKLSIFGAMLKDAGAGLGGQQTNNVGAIQDAFAKQNDQIEQQNQIKQFGNQLPSAARPLFNLAPEQFIGAQIKQMLPQDPVKLGEGDSLVDPRSGRTVASSPKPTNPLLYNTTDGVVRIGRDGSNPQLVYRNTKKGGGSGLTTDENGNVILAGDADPLTINRYALASNRITNVLQKNPAFKAVTSGGPYLDRIEAAIKHPGSVGDQEILDAFTQLNNGGGRVTEAQVHLITHNQSLSDWMGKVAQTLQRGGALSPQQRQEVHALAKEVYGNYQRTYKPMYEAAAKQLKAAGIPKQFWTIPDPEFLSRSASDEPQAPDAPPKIANDADYAKLPSGAEFIAPDGSHRKKP